MVTKLLLPRRASSVRSLTRRRMAAVGRVLTSAVSKVLVGELVHETVGRIGSSVATLTLLVRWLWALDILLLVRALILALLLLAVVRLIRTIHEVPRAARIPIGTL